MSRSVFEAVCLPNYELKNVKPNGLRFCFPDNEAALRQWTQKFQQLENSQTERIKALEKALSRVDLLPTTSERLTRQLEAEKKFLQFIQSFIQSELAFTEADQASVIKNRIPARQHAESYIKNIFRDWAWGDNENKIYAEFLKKLQKSDGLALIVGGGAGRLLWDYLNLQPGQSVCQIDINPLLSFVAREILSGRTLELTEFSHMPNSLNKLSLDHTLKLNAEAPEPHRFDILTGDILQHPFQDQAFNRIVCPYVIDILPENFHDFSKRLNHLLAQDGELLIFGPLSFEQQPAAYKLTLEEVSETLNQNGFQVISSEQHEVPYLHSPLDAQKRNEQIICVYARKLKTCKKPKSFQYFPNWLTDTKQKMTPDEVQKYFPVQAQKNLEAQFLAALINGQTIDDMAQAISQSNSGLNLDQARDFVRAQFARLFESGELK